MCASPCKRLAVLCILILASGCGSTPAPTSTSTAAPTYPAITGNWSISAASQISLQTYLMGGYITNTNGSVSGTIHVLNSPCYSITEDVPITGTVSTSGTVTATSPAVANQVITIGGTITSTVFTAGTYAITGGCATGDHGSVSGYSVASYSHAYIGSFISTPTHINIVPTIIATQNGPDSDGFYHVTGTASFSGSPCFTSGTLAASAIAGPYMSITITTNNGTVTFAGYATDSTGKTITGTYSIAGGTCSGDYGTGSVSDS
jgi:hypothetical protein